MLCTLNEILPHAKKHGYAVPAFDYIEDVFVRPILEASGELRAPVILAGLPANIGGRGLDYIAGIVKAVAPAYAIPVVLHLDHAGEIEVIKRAIAAGFTSVMFDGSGYPLGENIAKTREVVKYAHARGVTVEAELGFVAGTDLGGDAGDVRLTEPGEVERFVAETEVDALAVSIGTIHGVYRAAPRLDLARLAEIVAVTDVPLVLHGGSGTPEDQLKDAIRGGIAKLNIYTDMRIAMNAGVAEAAAIVGARRDELPDRVLEPLYRGVFEQTKRNIDLTMCAGAY
ncbi:MAG: class II fructose-bisphosphate aldolase [Planctomycetota bacterium]|jgi:fructose-bisphosphate aldolase class II|nr:class II fructose-bisphosphate aldolase [Planctomycetota bacterium]